MKKICDLCEKDIAVKTKRYGTNSGTSTRDKHYKTLLDSEEGVNFREFPDSLNSSYWFCNSCWEEIMKGVKLPVIKNE